MPPDENFLGTKKFLHALKKNFPALMIGNFSHYLANE